MLNEQLYSIVFFKRLIKRINVILICTGFLLVIGFAVVLTSSGSNAEKDFLGQRSRIGIIPQKLVKKSVKYYDRILSRRKLFVVQAGTGSDRQPVRARKEQEAGGLDISQFQLLGIVSGSRGQQAIISDIKDDRSFYCYGGENIEGYTVEEVKTDSVLLKKDQQTFELKL